ncbi:MAG: hypothetical protein EG825_17480 [Rhodocyclaceae bacterium]|nr:hypothetical protein [Rhodocyclaceae bacterium]
MRRTLLAIVLWPSCLLAQTSFVVETGNGYTARGLYQAIPYNCFSFETTWNTPGTAVTTTGYITIETYSGYCQPDYTPFNGVAADVALFRFDTSAIPDNATVTAASINIYGTAPLASSFGGLRLYASYCAVTSWPSSCAPTGYPNSTGTYYISSWSTSASWKSVPLEGLASISKTGYTGIQLRLYGTTLSWPGYQQSHSMPFNGPSASSNKSYLSVTYTVPGGARVIMIVDSE